MGYLGRLSSDEVYISMMSLGELYKGALRKQRTDPAQGHAITKWIETLEQRFEGRILGIDIATMRLWGELSAGRTRPVIDTLLAATAILNDLTLVTRNVADFEDIPVRWVNPWAL